MTQAGIKHGLEKDLAETLARQTVIGSAHLLKLDNRSAMDLRKAVTSKGGTTQAALETLMSNDAFHTLLSDAIKAGKKRSEDLS
jgi:pyrroline-5-carboxylate reductase